MVYNDHPLPHFHIQQGDEQAIMTISDGMLLRGTVSAATLRRIRDWAASDCAALEPACQRARAGEAFGEI